MNMRPLGPSPSLRLVHRARRCCVRELPDGIGDPSPRRGAVVIALGCEIVGTPGALFLGLVAEAFEHQGRGPPDVDFGYHG